jgi:hypothetical protein
MRANRLKISENGFRGCKTSERYRPLQRQLNCGLRNCNAPGMTGLAVVVVGAVPVQRRVKAQQAHRKDDDDSE